MGAMTQFRFRRALALAFFLSFSIFFCSVRSAHAAYPAGPCDILLSKSTPCVAAYSTVRVLLSTYTGPLYQVTYADDTSTPPTMNILPLSDGYANAASQDSFCAGHVCFISILYDQSSDSSGPNHNDLSRAPGGDATNNHSVKFDNLAFANALPLQAGKHKVYGVYISGAAEESSQYTPGVGYRLDSTHDVATGSNPQGIYMVSSTAHLDGLPKGIVSNLASCCFDFGNAETDNTDTGTSDNGAMDALNLRAPGTLSSPGTPKIALDLENGLFGDYPITADPSINELPPFVTAMSSFPGSSSAYTLWQGSAQDGTLQSALISLPQNYTIDQQGAIVLGIGGDNSDQGIGSFFEGAMTATAIAPATADLIQANIVNVSYDGLLPYHDDFASGTADKWATYNGSFQVSGETYVNSANDDQGDKAIAGSPTWDNYTLQGDVQLTAGSGDAGLLLRVTNPGTGTNALNGYYAGVTLSGNLEFGRMANSWTPLKTVAIPGGVTTGTWYHLTVQATGCTFTITAQAVGTTNPTIINGLQDSGCTFTMGAIGVRSLNMEAKWRDVQVFTGGVTSSAPYYAPFANAPASGPMGWSQYGGSWTTSGENYINSTSSDASDLSTVNSFTCNSCTLTGDVDITTTSGDAGFLLRAANPAKGDDAVNSYYVGIDAGGYMFVKNETNGASAVPLTIIPLYSQPSNAWFHLTAQVNTVPGSGCEIKVTVQRNTSIYPGNETTIPDPGCTFAKGSIGVQSSSTSARWRYLSVFSN